MIIFNAGVLAQDKPAIVIIIDDMGYDKSLFIVFYALA